MVLGFHRNKWITGGDPTKHRLQQRDSAARNSSPSARSRSEQGDTVTWCNESAGHGQMMDVETSYSDFINCDRTGRRNAVPDIAGEGEGEGAASTSELTKDLAEMDLKAAEGVPGASPAPEAEGSTSQDAQGGGGPS